jgi:hypothetical protein
VISRILSPNYSKNSNPPNKRAFISNNDSLNKA